MILPVTVPLSVNPGAGSATMSQDTEPDTAPFAAVKLKDPSGEVKVRSKLAGMKSPVAPSLRVRNAGPHVVDSELLWGVMKSNVPSGPQSAVPARRLGARLGSAEAGTATPSNSAEIPTVSIERRSVFLMTGPPLCAVLRGLSIRPPSVAVNGERFETGAPQE